MTNSPSGAWYGLNERPRVPNVAGGSQGGTASGMVPIHHTANDFEIVITAHKQDTLPHVLVCVLMEVIDPVICTQ